MDITAKGFGKPHTNFDVLLSMHAEFDCGALHIQFFFSDLDVGTCIF